MKHVLNLNMAETNNITWSYRSM